MRTYIHSPMRKAIAMIELIFAIVIMGITLLSAPLILNMSIQSSSTAMQQEAIAAAASQLNLVLTQYWDESDTNATFDILDVSDGASALDNAGKILYSRRVSIAAGFTDAVTSTSLGSDIGENDVSLYDDIDDFDGITTEIDLYILGKANSLLSNEGEYIDLNITMTNEVVYGDDVGTGATNYAAEPVVFNNPFSTKVTVGSTNIKLVSVTLTTGSTVDAHNKSISLSAFSCNIGNSLPNTQNY